MNENKKLVLSDIKFELVEEILNKLFNSKQTCPNSSFDDKWNEYFVNKFRDDVCKKNQSGEYENEIVKAIYENCKSFYEKECDNIAKHITDINNSIEENWDK